MSSIPKVTCQVHQVEFIVGSTIYPKGETPRRHLVSPVEGCAWLTGNYCSQCRDLIRSERRPEHDRDVHHGKAIFAAYICPICGYDNFEVEPKSGVSGKVL